MVDFTENKKAYVQTSISSVGCAKYLQSIFNRMVGYEEKWGIDLAEFTNEQLKQAVNEMFSLKSMDSANTAKSYFKNYQNWYIENKLGTPEKWDIKIEWFISFDRVVIDNERNLALYLKHLFGESSPENYYMIYKCVYWLVYIGIHPSVLHLIEKKNVVQVGTRLFYKVTEDNNPLLMPVRDYVSDSYLKEIPKIAQRDFKIYMKQDGVVIKDISMGTERERNYQKPSTKYFLESRNNFNSRKHIVSLIDKAYKSSLEKRNLEYKNPPITLFETFDAGLYMYIRNKLAAGKDVNWREISYKLGLINISNKPEQYTYYQEFVNAARTTGIRKFLSENKDKIYSNIANHFRVKAHSLKKNYKFWELGLDQE